MIGDDESLVLAAVPLVGHRSPISAAEVRSIIDSAADAGFSCLSIWTDHHDWAVADGMASQEYFDYHRERGLSMPAAEVIFEWAGADRQAIADANAHMLDVTAGAGARSIIAVAFESELPPIRDAAVGLRDLCDLAAGAAVALRRERGDELGIALVAVGCLDERTQEPARRVDR